MIAHGLATLWMKLRRPIYHRISPVLIVILLSIVIDGVFWYFGIHGAHRDRSAFVDLATAWAVAVMSLAASLFIAAITELRSSRNTQQIAYDEFLSLSDKLDAARAKVAMAESDRDAVRSDLDVANKHASLNPDEANLNARLVAYAKFMKAETALSSVRAAVLNLRDAYCAAESAVERVVTPSVRPAFDEFRKCPPEDATAHASARSRFAQAAHIDNAA